MLMMFGGEEEAIVSRDGRYGIHPLRAGGGGGAGGGRRGGSDGVGAVQVTTFW